MLKQRFTRSITLCVVMLLLLSSIARAQERKVGDVITFDFKCEKLGDLQEASFLGAEKVTIHRDFAPHAAFISPEWKKGRDEQYPVGYKAGTSAQVSAVFEICEDVIKNPNATVFAKGLVGGKEVFPIKALGNKTFTTATYENGMAITPFTAGMVDFFDPYQIEWYISRDKSNWELAGTSMNRLYVPLSKVLDAKGCALDDERVFYSIIHYACAPAEGLGDEAEIIKTVFEVFKSKSVSRIDKPQTSAMLYWGIKNNPSTSKLCRGIKGLLNEEDCRCGEWASFFQSCLAMHGIKACAGDIDAKTINTALYKQFEVDYQKKFKFYPPSLGINSTRRVFLVKNWTTLVNSTLYVASNVWPYKSVTLPLKDANGGIIPIGDQLGIPAQGNVDPEAIFYDHLTVCVGAEIYDPSYGTGPFKSIEEWEQNSLDAHAIYTTYLDTNNMETYTLLWILEPELLNNQTTYKCN